MRVLCLHTEASSALQLSKDAHKLEERLYTKHGIELVFVDAPLLDVQLGQSVGDDGGGINAIEPSAGDDGSEDFVSRRWYVREDARTALAEGFDSEQTSAVRLAGLDASLLHLQQIWKRGGTNVSKNTPGDCECFPFQGVLGFGQGANVAALLPLLSTTQTEDKDDAPPLFQGLQFVALVGGTDIMDSQPGDDTREELGIGSEDLYVGSDGLASMHILLEGADRETCRSGANLARKYGPNAQVHRVPQSIPNCNATLCNILGKFLVSQKNALRNDPKAMELLSLQTRLLDIEHLATLALSNEIQQNPPKALMSVIGPAAVSEKDGKSYDAEDRDTEKENNEQPIAKVVDRAVGAWSGARRRGFGEEGGGAPCPQDFLLKEEERK